MPHTNNKGARDRKAARGSKKPAFLQKKAKSSSQPSAKSSVLPPTAFVDPSIPKNRQEQTQLIRRFHAIEKQLASPALTDSEERKKLEEEREELGGLEGYQAASVHGAEKSRGGETSKWLVKQIKALKVGLDDEKKPEKPVEPTILEDGTKVWPKKERRKLRLLDVGAIAGTAYADFNWIDTTSIDLNPQAEHVIKTNFFDFPVPQTEEEKYDLVSLSLVMNYEGSLANRGHMLLHSHSYLRPRGYLYLVLPLPCLTNSRYMTPDRLRQILTSTGWEVAQQHDSSKLTHWLLRRSEQGPDGQVWKRENMREGVMRNNFVIVVRPGEEVEKPGEGKKRSAEDDDAEDGGESKEEEKLPPKKKQRGKKAKANGTSPGAITAAEDVKMGDASAPVEAEEKAVAPAPAPAVEGKKQEDQQPAQQPESKKLGKNAKKKAAKAAKAAAASGNGAGESGAETTA
ncbi:hypothetical protein JCM11251_001098 [Rhodosporidiobolus azoricus]